MKDECLIGQLPSVWPRQFVYDQRAYVMEPYVEFVSLGWKHLRENRVKASVQLTLIPRSLASCDVYLLPGHEENEHARVLLVSVFGDIPMLKLLPLTMKEILAKLHEQEPQDDPESETSD